MSTQASNSKLLAGDWGLAGARERRAWELCLAALRLTVLAHGGVDAIDRPRLRLLRIEQAEQQSVSYARRRPDARTGQAQRRHRSP